MAQALSKTLIEANRGVISVSAPTSFEVKMTIDYLRSRLGEGYAQFSRIECGPDGFYRSQGTVRIQTEAQPTNYEG